VSILTLQVIQQGYVPILLVHGHPNAVYLNVRLNLRLLPEAWHQLSLPVAVEMLRKTRHGHLLSWRLNHSVEGLLRSETLPIGHRSDLGLNRSQVQRQSLQLVGVAILTLLSLVRDFGQNLLVALKKFLAVVNECSQRSCLDCRGVLRHIDLREVWKNCSKQILV
jgi:hypothetical protein